MEDNQSIIEQDHFQNLQIGGQLDIFMRGSSSLLLNERQIAEIRQKNISLSLRQEGISWDIPPSNFVPGEAILRFYKGEPLGIEEKLCSYSNIYTISIYQANARSGIYPSAMKVHYDLKKQKIADKENLEAAYFNREEKEWLALDKEKTEHTFTLETRYTGAVGIFKNVEKELEKEKLLPGKAEDTKTIHKNISTLSLVIISGSIILIIGIFFFRKKS